MKKIIVAGVTTTVVVGTIILQSDLACKYSPFDISWINECATISSTDSNDQTAANDVNKLASNESAQKDADQKAKDEAAKKEAEAKKLAEEKAAADKKAAEEAAAKEDNPLDPNSPNFGQPVIDIARVEPDGSTLVAGRGAPNTKIMLKNGDQVIGEADANGAGEWVIIADQPLTGAQQALSVIAMMPDGKQIASPDGLLIALKQPEGQKENKDAIQVASVAEKAKATTEAATDMAKDAAKAATDMVAGAAEKTAEMAKEGADAVTETATDAANATADAATDAAKSTVEAASDATKAVTEGAEQVASEATDAATKTGEAVVDGVKSLMSSGAETVANATDGAADMAKDAAKTGVAAVATTVANAGEVTKEAADAVTDRAEKMVDGAADATKEAATDAVETGKAVINALTGDKAPTDGATTSDNSQEASEEKSEATSTETEDKSPLVVLTSAGKASKVLQGAGGGSGDNQMTFNSLDFDRTGEVIFSGDAKAGELINVYVNSQFVGQAVADKNGRWTLDQAYIMMAGKNTMRFDRVDAAGKVLSRRETQIDMPKLDQEKTIAANKAKAEAEKAAANEKAKVETMVASNENSDQANDSASKTSDTDASSDASSTTTGANGSDASSTETSSNQSTTAISSDDQAQTAGNDTATDSDQGAEKEKKLQAIIIWGDNLWNISQKVYGKGELYTNIYKANSDQIRDPNLIYPGQVFILPEMESNQ